MANEARKAILRALIADALVELHPKTVAENVWLDSTTTLAAKLSELITSLNAKAKPSDITAAINGLRSEMLGDTPVEAYNTFTELAAYIEEHQEVADALTKAIGSKADASVVEALQTAVNGLGSLAKKSTVSENDLDASLKQKVNAAAQGNHSHSNQTVLDGITSAKVSEWNGKGRFIPSATRPADLKSGDLWAELVE